MKRCSTSLIIREMHVKTIMRYYFIPIRMAVVKNKRQNQKTRVAMDVEILEPLYIVDENVKL